MRPFKHRICVRKVNIGLPCGLLVISVYLEHGIGLKGYNLEVLEAVAAFVVVEGNPFIIPGDFNAEPEEFEELCWLQRLSASVVAPSGPTCCCEPRRRLD